MKTYVITLSKTFPTGHIRAGEPTNFAHLLGNGLNLTDVGNGWTVDVIAHILKHIKQ